MWTFNKKPIIDITQIPEGAVGFVYKITNVDTGQVYYGKKSLFSTRTLPPLKGTKRKRKVTKESDWYNYRSSSTEILKNWNRITRTILGYAYSKKHLTYLETKFLFKYDALEDPNCVNENITGKYFRGEFDGK